MKPNAYRYAPQPHPPLRITKIERIPPIFLAVNEQKGNNLISSSNRFEKDLDILAILLDIAGGY